MQCLLGSPRCQPMAARMTAAVLARLGPQRTSSSLRPVVAGRSASSRAVRPWLRLRRLAAVPVACPMQGGRG